MNKKKTAEKPASQAKGAGSKLKVVPSTLSLERQPKESPEAFEAWQCYLKHKTESNGGIKEVVKELKKSQALIGRWSSRHNWKERYRLYQNQQQLVQDREQRKAITERARQWANRRINLRDEGFKVGELLVKRGEALLGLPMYDREVKKEIEVKGEKVATVTILNFNQHPKDAVAFIREGIKLMRLSADMTTENLTGIPEDVDLDELGEEELIAIAEKLKEIRTEQLKGGIV